MRRSTSCSQRRSGPRRGRPSHRRARCPVARRTCPRSTRPGRRRSSTSTWNAEVAAPSTNPSGRRIARRAASTTGCRSHRETARRRRLACTRRARRSRALPRRAAARRGARCSREAAHVVRRTVLSGTSRMPYPRRRAVQVAADPLGGQGPDVSPTTGPAGPAPAVPACPRLRRRPRRPPRRSRRRRARRGDVDRRGLREGQRRERRAGTRDEDGAPVLPSW